MAMFYKPPAINPPYHGDPDHPMHFGPHMEDPNPPNVEPVNPLPWIIETMPPEDEIMPPPEAPPEVVIEPTVVPPAIKPPIWDITPESIVPLPFETPKPSPIPNAETGGVVPLGAPASIMVIGALAPVGTFMVYVGKRLVLSMAASIGNQLGASVGAMLVGPLGKTMGRGVRLRYHTGVSPGSLGQVDNRATAASYSEQWSMAPQEFSYWEA